MRPSDLVGALANETGMSGQEVGQIHITATASFVGLAKDVADEILADHKEIEIRGNPVTISLSRTTPPSNSEGHSGRSQSRGRYKPSKGKRGRKAGSGRKVRRKK